MVVNYEKFPNSSRYEHVFKWCVTEEIDGQRKLHNWKNLFSLMIKCFDHYDSVVCSVKITHCFLRPGPHLSVNTDLEIATTWPPPAYCSHALIFFQIRLQGVSEV